jgi:hypothetical protein
MFGGWIACGSPVVYHELLAGIYDFQVRATDFAGNSGIPSRSHIFVVNITLLPLPAGKVDYAGWGYEASKVRSR